MIKEILPVSSSLDITNPRSLISIAPNKVKDALTRLPSEYLEMSEYELEQMITPNPFVNRVRNAFWQEYEKAQGEVRQFNIHNVTAMVGTMEQHIYRLLKDDVTAAWIFCPPTAYIIFLDEALNFGLKRLRDNILTLPMKDLEGNIDKDNCNLILKTVAFLDMRKNGAVVQKTMNMNINSTTRDMKDVSKEVSMLDLDEKIRLLEERQKLVDKRDNKSKAIEVETT